MRSNSAQQQQANSTAAAMAEVLKLLFSFIFIGVFSFFIYLYRVIILNPKKLRSELRNQGINGPNPSSIYGNISEMRRIQSTAVIAKDLTIDGKGLMMSHDYASNLFPYFEQWRKQYGPIFTYSTGRIQMLYVSDVKVLKEISLHTSLDLGKPSYIQKERKPLFGQGILMSSGELWAQQRKIIAPEFYMEKVKRMMNLMVDSATSLMETWSTEVESAGGIANISRVDLALRNLTADVISRACFGSSYTKGRELFSKLRTLQEILSKNGLPMGVPGLRNLPTKNNRRMWRLEKEIDSFILTLVRERREAKSEKDLLQMLLEGAKSHGDTNLISMDRFIIDNCKNIYFAGHETTATTASWILVLLASNPEWQIQARAEAQEVCQDSLPDFGMLRKMKVLTMVIQETLRLYPPAAFVTRAALNNISFNDIHIPKGVNIWIPVITLHHNKEIWGQDALEFKPDRFAKGIAGACSAPQAYIPFGIGTRSCAGQNFAMVQLKIIISLILSKFSFTLSPTYKHSPAFKLVIEPGHGVDLIIKSL